jgi:RimJ/RimL family protein N-acetyltransferase
MIRIATPWDGTSIEHMLDRYRNSSPLDFHKHTPMEYARKILAQIWAGRGVAFVSEDSSGITGMLIALKNPNMWDPTVITMNELAYWVNPERRGTSAGYRLLKAYVDYCKELKNKGEIEYYTVSKMSTSPDLDYGRFGFNRLEETWSQ